MIIVSSLETCPYTEDLDRKLWFILWHLTELYVDEICVTFEQFDGFDYVDSFGISLGVGKGMAALSYIETDGDDTLKMFSIYHLDEIAKALGYIINLEYILQSPVTSINTKYSPTIIEIGARIDEEEKVVGGGYYDTKREAYLNGLLTILSRKYDVKWERENA